VKATNWTTPRDPQCPSCGKTFMTLEKAVKLTPGKAHDIACQNCGYVIPMEVEK
jgi:DNA-directed RNA polymerase subunit RPC12/RpoP